MTSSRDYDYDVQPVLLGAWTHRGEPSKLASNGDLCQLIALVDRPRVTRVDFRPAPSRLNTPIAAVRLRFSVNGETIDEALLDISLDRVDDVVAGDEPVTAASVSCSEAEARFHEEKTKRWTDLADAMAELPPVDSLQKQTAPDGTATYVPRCDTKNSPDESEPTDAPRG